MSEELLTVLPITHDEYAAALKEMVHERVFQNRRRDWTAQQARAEAMLAAAEAEAASTKPKKKEK